MVRCPWCKSVLLAKLINKTRTCPQCGHRSDLRGLRVLGRANSSREALTLIQTIKKKNLGKKNGNDTLL